MSCSSCLSHHNHHKPLKKEEEHEEKPWGRGSGWCPPTLSPGGAERLTSAECPACCCSRCRLLTSSRLLNSSSPEIPTGPLLLSSSPTRPIVCFLYLSPFFLIFHIIISLQQSWLPGLSLSVVAVSSPPQVFPAKNRFLGLLTLSLHCSVWPECRSHRLPERWKCPCFGQAECVFLFSVCAPVVSDRRAADFFGGNSTKATSGINGALTRTQTVLGIQDSVKQFYEDTLKSARDKARPDLIKVLTYKSASAVEWLQDVFNLDLTLVSRLGCVYLPFKKCCCDAN